MRYPALGVAGIDTGLVLAIADEHGPTAAEDVPGGVRLYFTDARHRDSARAAILSTWPDARLATLEVDDEDWARRSQEGLTAITIGRLTILPTPPAPHDPPGPPAPPAPLVLVIVPSTGFGTGHHPTTRLCLAGLQRLNLEGRTLLDVGTGSGVLALAGRLLGARSAIGIDNDVDAVRSAEENLALNPRVTDVSFRIADLGADGSSLPGADVVTANLTGALLRRVAPILLDAVQPGGMLIVSGLLAEERDDVAASFAAAERVDERSEDEWVAITWRVPPTP